MMILMTIKRKYLFYCVKKSTILSAVLSSILPTKTTESSTVTNISVFLNEFITKLQANLIKKENFVVENHPNFNSLYETIFSQVKGCDQKCPCCDRICDRDHTLDGLKHGCDRGHQIRAISGIKKLGTKIPSLKVCNEISPNSMIVDKSGVVYKWTDFKKHHSTWDFEEIENHKMINDIETFRGIWKKNRKTNNTKKGL